MDIRAGQGRASRLERGVPGRLSRLAAGGAAAAGVVGAGGLLVAAVRGGVLGYLSEAGTPGAPSARLYQLSIWALAVSLALLAVAARPAVRSAAVALLAAAPFAAVSGAVTCTAGCPLPPYEPSTGRDLVHAGASIAALSLFALAMLLVAAYAQSAPLRRVSRVGAAVGVPLLAASGVALLIAGRGVLTGVVERLALAALLGWLVAAAMLLARGEAADLGRKRQP
jgi:Protein of unknown function (DUF998)